MLTSWHDLIIVATLTNCKLKDANACNFVTANLVFSIAVYGCVDMFFVVVLAICS